MKSADYIKTLEEEEEANISQKASNEDKEFLDDKSAYLIFVLSDRKFAVKADSIKEVVRDALVYELPFVPVYIKGVLNRRGDAYSVIDLTLFLSQNASLNTDVSSDKSAEKSIFLIINDNMNTAFKVSAIEKFKFVSGKEFCNVADITNMEFFNGAILDECVIPILDVQAVMRQIQIELDVENT